MDDRQFDAIARGYGADKSRRTAIKTLGSGAVAVLLGRLGLDAGRKSGAAAAEVGGDRKKKRKKSKKPKLKLNAFRCVDVGGTCQGNSANCCSGICEGKKPKKGKKDTSRCAGHDAGICPPGSNTCKLEGTAECNPSNSGCHCVGTTGNATFCGDTSGVASQESCRVCGQDTDCQDEFGPGAACIVLEGLCSIYCADTGHTACVPPCAGEAS